MTMQFVDLGLGEPLLRSLATEGYLAPTPIQCQAIPPVIAGRDVLAGAQTGTGKTAAFALPLLERMTREPSGALKIRVLVLAPTRELVKQIDESFRTYGRHTRLRCTPIYGGVSIRMQADALRRGVEIVAATPGRLLDLVQQRLIDLRHVEFLVLDEADRMLDMGFIHDVRKLLAKLPAKKQTLFFSATLPAEVRQLAATLLNDPHVVQTERESAAAPLIDQVVYHVEGAQKRKLLVSLLGMEAMLRVLVFTRTKHGADRLQRDLRKAGIRAEAIHGNKSQAARERVLVDFRANRLPVLVATDVAARGLDIDQVSHVFNYDMPHDPETYVHRIGRTGRAGETGTAVSFCGSDERSRLRAIERLTRQAIAVEAHPTLPDEPAPERPAQERPAKHGSHGETRHKPRPPAKAGQGNKRGWNRGPRGAKKAGRNGRPARGATPSSH
jgi:ATP-dependent RNA helicase RhlE